MSLAQESGTRTPSAVLVWTCRHIGKDLMALVRRLSGERIWCHTAMGTVAAATNKQGTISPQTSGRMLVSVSEYEPAWRQTHPQLSLSESGNSSGGREPIP